ncbi:hypothetical protein ACP70R_003107 [Stipagrostis hirtigluma subsp. patula]
MVANKSSTEASSDSRKCITSYAAATAGEVPTGSHPRPPTLGRTR